MWTQKAEAETVSETLATCLPKGKPVARAQQRSSNDKYTKQGQGEADLWAAMPTARHPSRSDGKAHTNKGVTPGGGPPNGPSLSKEINDPLLPNTVGQPYRTHHLGNVPIASSPAAGLH